jgi:hypothetical protein
VLESTSGLANSSSANAADIVSNVDVLFLK